MQAILPTQPSRLFELFSKLPLLWCGLDGGVKLLAHRTKETVMGAWGHLPFDDDATNDWAYGLEHVDDLSLVEAAFGELEGVGVGYLDHDVACNALGACEVLARLLGHSGYTNDLTEATDQWVAAHKIIPPPALLQRASAALDRILGSDSELHALWDETGEVDIWRTGIEDLRGRLRP